MPKRVLDPDTYIRELPFSVIYRIALMLDPHKRWMELLAHIPKKLDDPSSEGRYSYAEAQMFEYLGGKPNSSATRHLLKDWGSTNARLRHLIKALEDGELFMVSTFLKDDFPDKPVVRDKFISSHSQVKEKEETVSSSYEKDFIDVKDTEVQQVLAQETADDDSIDVMDNEVQQVLVQTTLDEDSIDVMDNEVQKVLVQKTADEGIFVTDHGKALKRNMTLDEEKFDITEKAHTQENISLQMLLIEAKKDFEMENMKLCKDSKNNNEVVIIGYDKTISLSEVMFHHIYNVQIYLKNPKNISAEAHLASNFGLENNLLLSEREEELLIECIRKHSFKLWTMHSNLTMISGDCVKSTNGKMERRVCVVLYCVSKGFIPVNEDFFPTYLDCGKERVDIDVREGYFQLGSNELMGKAGEWNDPVCMGSSIGEENTQKYGSVGLFVDLPNSDTGFVTCCHVLLDCMHSPGIDKTYSDVDSVQTIIQPSLVDFCGRDITERQCGTIKRAVFKPSTDPVSVDAALVKMTNRKPSTGHFVIRTKQQVTEAGFDERNFPLYNGGRILKEICREDREKPLIKSGATTGLTKGEFKLNGMEVYIAKEGAFLGDTSCYFPKKVMKGQYEVKSSSTFFDLGDSGSGVFLKNPDGSLQCVGIAIGKTSYNTTIVTPIGAVLDALGLNDSNITNFAYPMHVG